MTSSCGLIADIVGVGGIDCPRPFIEDGPRRTCDGFETFNSSQVQ